MKIGLVCRPWTFHGGVETATAGLVAELVRQGDTVDLITWSCPPPVSGIRVRRLAVVTRPSLARVLSVALAARAAARRGGYDVVQSHERILFQDVYRAGEGTHRGYLAAMGRSGRSPFDVVVLRLERRIFTLQAARHVVAISQPGAAEIRRLYGTPAPRVTVVYNGVDLERFHPERAAAMRPAARAEIGLPRDAWVALFVGSGFARKGLDALIEGFAALGDSRARLAIAGHGNAATFRAAAQRLAVGHQVIWLGARADVERLYAAADAVVLAARYEPFGNVVLEALASGRPVITSRAVGASDLVRSGVNGWVVAEAGAAALGQALQKLRDGDPARPGEACRRTALPYTQAAQVGALRDVYRRLGPPGNP
jgi:UDP-glucose:(heptosyl)LPS alpha-1,3-glucosyltransferase